VTIYIVEVRRPDGVWVKTEPAYETMTEAALRAIELQGLLSLMVADTRITAADGGE
jgi:hypothetical protein